MTYQEAPLLTYGQYPNITPKNNALIVTLLGKRSFIYRSFLGGSIIFPCPDHFFQFLAVLHKVDVCYCDVKKLEISSNYFGRYHKIKADLKITTDVLLKITHGLLQTEDVLLKTKDGLLKTEDNRK